MHGCERRRVGWERIDLILYKQCDHDDDTTTDLSDKRDIN